MTFPRISSPTTDSLQKGNTFGNYSSGCNMPQAVSEIPFFAHLIFLLQYNITRGEVYSKLDFLA